MLKDMYTRMIVNVINEIRMEKILTACLEKTSTIILYAWIARVNLN